jgi:HAMP domain-containing protein/predicted Ser/Thr protein kinase
MGLTQKILLFTGLLVVALVVTTLGYTTFQAERLARSSVDQALTDTRDVWHTFQEDRYSKLKLGVRALANDPAFKSLVETRDEASVADTLHERGLDIRADFFIATDEDGVVIARSDRPDAQGQDLFDEPLVAAAIDGQESATVWRQGERLYHAVGVPMLTLGDLKGVLVAGYAIDERLAGEIRRLTRCDIAYLTSAPGEPPRVSVSTLGISAGSLQAALERSAPARQGSADPFEVNVGGERYVAVLVPMSDSGNAAMGSVLALRSLEVELAGYRQFRNSLVLVSLVVMVLALGIAYLVASRIAGPVRRLAELVEKARDGAYSGAVLVNTGDEIGVLAKTFNGLLAELREKEQMIGFLRDGMTALRRDQARVAAGAPTHSDLSSSETMHLEGGNLFAGRYEVLSTLGRGGMGVVYKAQDRQLDEVVALKVLRPDVLEQDSSLLERFKQEIKLARRITHRNVLRTHDFGETGGAPYISMEYLEGVTLKELVTSKGALPLGVGLRVARQMCLGLEAAHNQGVVHRDIKPQNMLILPDTGELKIMDFGIARVSEVKKGEAGLTSTGTVLGTPDYLPPEQAQGQPADFRSDIYSLGVVLYEIFCGVLPFRAETVMAVVLSHVQTPPPPPRQVNPALPPSLEAVILRCLEKDPAQRFQRVEELLAQLNEINATEGASAA